MIRYAFGVVALITLMPGMAGAEEFNTMETVYAWYDAHGDCHMQANLRTGADLTEEEWTQRCVLADRLTKELLAHGLCFDRGEQVWGECGGGKVYWD